MIKRYLPIIIIVALVTIGLVITTLTKSDTPQNTPVVSNGRYVALGDSVVAGIGLADYSDASACNRTEQSYPHAVARKLNYTLDNVACSSATTSEGLVGPQNVNRLLVEPQIDAATQGGKPKLITMTIGANDADWTTLIQKCYTGVCGSADDTAQAAAGITQASTNIKNALDRIQATYSTDTPRVVITGYYKLYAAEPVANCTELTGLDQAELTWIAGLQNNIDEALQAAAADSTFATYASVSFAGHELCSAEPWIQGLSGKAPFHPTTAGQTAIADQVLQTIENQR